MKYLFVVALLLGLSPAAFGSCDGTTIEHPVVDGDRTWNIAKNVYGSDTKTANMLGKIWDLSTIASGHIAHIAPGDIIVLPCVSKAPTATRPVISVEPTPAQSSWNTTATPDPVFMWCPEDYLGTDVACLVKDEESLTPLPTKKYSKQFVAPVAKKSELVIDSELPPAPNLYDPYSMQATNEWVDKVNQNRRAALRLLEQGPPQEKLVLASAAPVAAPIEKAWQRAGDTPVVKTPAPAAKAKKVKVAKAPKPKNYEVSFQIENSTGEIKEGFFPALLAKNPDEELRFQREKAGIVVRKANANFYDITVILDKEPPKESAILPDSQSGMRGTIPASYLLGLSKNGVDTKRLEFPEHAYDSLYAAVPKRDGRIWGSIKRIGTFGMRNGTTLAVAAYNPSVLVPWGMGLASNQVRSKQENSRIQMLDQKVDAIGGRLDQILQMLTPQQPAPVLAQK